MPNLLLSLILSWTLRLLAASWRVERSGQGALEGGAQIQACLHRDLLAVIILHRDPRSCALVSQSKDGQLVAEVLSHLNVGPAVRGSSSRGGARARAQMQQILESGGRVGITVDGPRGPAGVVKAGAIRLLQWAPLTGIRVQARPALRLSSWDRMCIPLPFARVRIEYMQLARGDTQGAQERLQRWLNAP